MKKLYLLEDNLRKEKWQHWKEKTTGKSDDLYYCLEEHLDAQSPSQQLRRKSRAKKINLQKDVMTLFNFLSPCLALNIHHTSKTTYRLEENEISDKLAFLCAHLPDVIFITGNNDLSQLEHLAQTLRELKQHLILTGMSHAAATHVLTNIPIVISGKGGHGTTPGPIFASSEASAMAKHLEFFLIDKDLAPFKNQFILEENATNTGQNIDFTKPALKEITEKAELKYKAAHTDKFPGIKMWLIPTPIGSIRQLTTFSHQPKEATPAHSQGGGPGYPIAMVYTLPANNIEKIYLSCDKDIEINMFAALREASNYLSYVFDLEKQFLSPYMPHERNLRSAIATIIHYYELLTENSIAKKNTFIETIISFIKQKASFGHHHLSAEYIQLAKEISLQWQPIKLYFSTMFNQIERQQMENLSQDPAFQDLEKNAVVEKQKYKTKQIHQLFCHHPTGDIANIHDACRRRRY